MKIFRQVTLFFEGLKFGYRRGKELYMQDPLMTSREMMLRTNVEWCEHICKTGRADLMKSTWKEWYDKAKEALNKVDEEKYSIYGEIIEAINSYKH